MDEIYHVWSFPKSLLKSPPPPPKTPILILTPQAILKEKTIPSVFRFKPIYLVENPDHSPRKNPNPTPKKKTGALIFFFGGCIFLMKTLLFSTTDSCGGVKRSPGGGKINKTKKIGPHFSIFVFGGGTKAK